MNQYFSRIAALVFLLVCGWVAPSPAQTYTPETLPNPKQSQSAHYVSNPDRILSAQTVSRIDSVLGRLEDSTTAQVAVVCVNSIGEQVPKEFATALFRKWGLGYRQKNNGLLILLVNDQHRIEMETGYGLEGVLPDAICKRIQAQHMIPLAKTGDFDGAVLAGVQEVARVLTEPAVKAEVYDESKKTAPPHQPVTNDGVLVLFLLLTPFLGLMWVVTYAFRSKNPVTDQIEAAVSKAKGRWAWAFLVYVVLPLGLGLVVIRLRQPLALVGWQILLILYVYPVAVRWDGRRRRKAAFTRLFGTMTEPERYIRLKAARFQGWGTILLAPFPFWWLKKRDDQALDALRNYPRESKEGYELRKADQALEDVFLTDYQKIEQQLGTVDYDVWRNPIHDITEIIGYENLADTTYHRCDHCGSKTMHFVGKRILTQATTEREGRGSNDYTCKACGHHREMQYTVSKIHKTTSHSSTHSSTTYSSSGSSSSSGGSSGRSSGSSSSWGGGSSGGGGAGSSW